MNRPRILFWDLTLVRGVLQPNLGLWLGWSVFKMIYDVLKVSSSLFLSSTRHIELFWVMWLLVKWVTKILTSCFKVLIDLIGKWENHTKGAHLKVKGNTMHFRVFEAYSIFILALMSWIRSHALVDRIYHHILSWLEVGSISVWDLR